MSASVSVTPASGSITAVVTACVITCDDIPNNTVTGYDPAIYPSSPQVTYYFECSKTGVDSLRSPVFSTNVDGTAAWNGVIFPEAGTWTVGVYATADDSTIVEDTGIVVA